MSEFRVGVYEWNQSAISTTHSNPARTQRCFDDYSTSLTFGTTSYER